eukprot:CAMPEP_0177766702 /NCGR_PEP_ID=MMETSP0491_2-20121128/8663_1 /TAXON_ID=63592 /ORGANISM="Tetraselmis chuii, Strain PLY429" /LENGTH=321 /DNA_ID=CAMNT_0019283129 /DNA_START=120 /DNA_END=1081 /DNA_ORIENTATION=+
MRGLASVCALSRPSPLARTARKGRRRQSARDGRVGDRNDTASASAYRCSIDVHPGLTGLSTVSLCQRARGQALLVTRSKGGDDVERSTSDGETGDGRADDGVDPIPRSTNVSSTLASLDALLGTTTPSADNENGETKRGGDVSNSTGDSVAQPLNLASESVGNAGNGEGNAEDDNEEASTGLAVPKVSPRVSYLMLGINLTVYGIGAGIALAGDSDASNSYFLSLACDHSAVASGEFYRLLTSTFMHAGLLHLGLNCAALLAVEAVLGYSTFSFVYLAAGLAGSTASFLITDNVTVGASGAIFGLLGALIAYFARNPGLER